MNKNIAIVEKKSLPNYKIGYINSISVAVHSAEGHAGSYPRDTLAMCPSYRNVMWLIARGANIQHTDPGGKYLNIAQEIPLG